MLKVMIVDDEPIMRKGIISKIDWEELQLVNAGEARDGSDALEQIMEKQPNIVLTDIRMPEMDGLELIARARKFDPELRFIVISGYEDFQYAREAIRYGVSDYLLKPVSRDELRSSLVKLRDELLAQGQERDYRTMLLKHYEANLTAVRQRKLTRLLQEDTADETAIAEYYRYWETAPASEYQVVVYRLEPIRYPHIGFSGEEEDLLWYCIQNIVEQAMKNKAQPGIVFRNGSRLDELIAVIASVPPESAIWLAQYSLDAIRQYLRLEASAGVGVSGAKLEAVHASYDQAVSAVRSAVLRGTGKVYASSLSGTPHLKEQGGIPRITSEQERLLSIHIRERNESWVRHWLEQRYGELAAIPDATYVQFERLSLHIYSLLNTILRELTGDRDAMLPDTGIFATRLLSFRNWRDASEALMETAKSVMRMISETKSATGGDIVDEVKRYIEQFFNEDITLGWVADQYYIHPNYFSKLFKLKCGENFNDFVTRIRLEKAVSLMTGSELTLAEIAEFVGYDSAAYFSNVFRKAYGMSPSKYREERRLNE